MEQHCPLAEPWVSIATEKLPQLSPQLSIVMETIRNCWGGFLWTYSHLKATEDSAREIWALSSPLPPPLALTPPPPASYSSTQQTSPEASVTLQHVIGQFFPQGLETSGMWGRPKGTRGVALCRRPLSLFMPEMWFRISVFKGKIME